MNKELLILPVTTSVYPTKVQRVNEFERSPKALYHVTRLLNSTTAGA